MLNDMLTQDGSMPAEVDQVALTSRRRAMAMIGGLMASGAGLLSGCGGSGESGTSNAASATSAATTTTPATTTAAAATTATSTTTTATPTTSATTLWPWQDSGLSSTATVPTTADFVQVIASGSVTYNFHVSATSSTTDPVTGAVSDTSSSATLAPYYMGKFLVTNANWKAFCDAQGSAYYPSTAKTAGQYWNGGTYPAGKENHPVFFVSLTQAQAYCAWLETRIAGYKFYVPTEGEWEYAALGGNTSYSYPWGSNANISYASASGVLSTMFNSNAVCSQYVLNNAAFATLTYYNDTVVTTLSDGSTPLSNDTAPLSKVLSMSSSGGVTGWQYDSTSNATWADFANSDQFRTLVNVYGGYSSAVGAYEGGKSWCGCHDLAGNAYEWTSTLNVAANGAEAGSSVNVVKGGSWYATSNSGKSSGRGEGRSASGAYHSVGFRVAARVKAS